MKKLFFIAAFSSLCSVAFAQQPSGAGTTIQSIPIGTALPDGSLEFQTTKGTNTTLDRTKGKMGLLVMFSCNTCPYVIKSQQRTKEIISTTQKRGIGMIIVNSNEAQRGGEDSYEAMVAYAKSQGYTVPYIRDDNSLLANDFGSSRTPEVFLFDGNGKLVYKGAMEDNPSDPKHSQKMYLEQAINNMIAGKRIDPAETKSIGCGIKRMQR